jgi:hypothetical protein
MSIVEIDGFSSEIVGIRGREERRDIKNIGHTQGDKSTQSSGTTELK